MGQSASFSLSQDMGNDSVCGQRADCVDFGKAREGERQMLAVPEAGAQGYRGAEVSREVPTAGLA